MKDLVRLAARDLDEGLVWLRQQNVDVDWILGMADHDIKLATWRLNLVRHALETHGPDARTI